MLGLHSGSVVSADTLIELLWGDDPPRTAAKALQTHISSLRRTLGDGFVLTQGAGWIVAAAAVDATRYKLAARTGREAAAGGDISQAVARFDEALALWRGVPELPDCRRGLSEKTRWIEGHAALVEDRADALLATGRAAEVIGDLEAAVAEAPLRERRWGQLMLALYRAGRQGEALGAYQRARALLADELGVDPGPELRRLEAAIVAQDTSLDIPVAQHLSSVTRAVTFLLTDIEGSTAAWEADADAMAAALARHDELIEQVVTARAGRLIKTRGEGDATFSVFERPSAAAAAAIEIQDAIGHEPWALREPLRIRVALHTGEVELRDGDYFGRAVNRAARLRSLAEGGQILCSGATAELVIDSLPDDVDLTDLGMRQLKNLARPEHVFELRLQTADDSPQAPTSDPPMQRPVFPPVLSGPGPFVGRGDELERLLSAWQAALAGGVRTVLIAGEPGVGKTRLAGEWSQRAYEQGAVVLYGRCDEDLGAPYQPFAEALRSLVPCMGASRLRGLRGVEALLPLVPGLPDVVPDLATPARADPDTERYALFDAVVALLDIASTGAPIVLILDDLHWAAKPTLLLLRHLLRFGDRARVQIVGTYRSTDLDRSHPLAAMLADLHRDGTAYRLNLSGLDQDDVTTYVAEAGYDDEELAHALASVTGGNPFFLIEALRHVDESGGVWDQSTLPQGVREAVSRRLSRLPAETNKALAAAAVVGSRFAVDLVEHVVGNDLIDAFDEACQAGIVIEEAGGHYRFNHAIVRQSLLAELASVRRMRLHQRIAATLETQPGADDELLAELAHHYFECAWAGNAAKAVFYCRRAADQAMARLAYEGAADLYDHALHALEELDEELPDRDDQVAELLIARCEALLAAGDVSSAAGAVSQLQEATVDSARLAAWATCFDGQLSVLIHPERLDEVETALGTAAEKLAALDDAAGEANAHTVRATCLGRLGRIAECEVALDDALTAARRAREYRRVNAVLAGAPLAALWGPNPVPRAGGRCLDVVRLLRITTDSPAVEATSTRCQAVLEAFRGRDAAARRMIDSARRTVTELGLRHALLEVEQFAGIVELVADDPAAAEPHLRQAYNGFRRMGLDADTAETAALLGRTCLALGRENEADELCSESERLAGHALKASIAWRTLRAKLLSRRGDHAEARRAAEAAVNLAGRTDALVDHGDACLALATVLDAAGDAAGARAAAERAVGLYERKGAAALAEKARRVVGEPKAPPILRELPSIEPTNACVQAGSRLIDAVNREALDEVVQLFAPYVSVESRRKVVGFPRVQIPSDQWPHEMRRFLTTGMVRYQHAAVAVRGERLALTRVVIGTSDRSSGAPQDEMLHVAGLDEDGRIALQVWFDIEDMDAAVAELDARHARFEEEQPRRLRLENAASRVDKRLHAYFAGRDWEAAAEALAEDMLYHDRRRVANAGLRHGRDAEIVNARVLADLGAHVTSTVIATRGERLVLTQARFTGTDPGPEAFHNVMLSLLEIDSDGRVLSRVVFDADDFDAALEELDARYLAGEAAAYAHTWSAISRTYAAFNRRELPPTTPDWVNVDHGQGRSFASGDTNAYLRATWDLAPDIKIYIEAVERLSDIGGVVTHAARGTSRGGFDAEWRETAMLTVDGELVNRSEVFDEADLETAIARFEQLSTPARQLENAASQTYDRFNAYFAHDWNAMAKLMADNFSSDDRRRLVGEGALRDRDAQMANIRASADLGFTNVTSTVIATRGQRLILTRVCCSASDQGPEQALVEVLSVVETNDVNRIAAIVVFDPDDIDAAIEELDTRYLAGEAADHAHTWSVITEAYWSLNRHELPPTTPDWVNLDHRRGIAFAPGDMTAYIRAKWDLEQDVRSYIEAVHRLNNVGAIFTQVLIGTSQEGFDAEWRIVELMTVEGDRIKRAEIFDETELDTALARFEQLSQPTPRLENAASHANERFLASFEARDWTAMAAILADQLSSDDRRRVVNAGLQQGRDVLIHNFRAAADLGVTRVTVDAIATRGERLVLTRARYLRGDEKPEAFQVDLLQIVESDADARIAALVTFDPDDFEAAIAELDARYLADEAAAHAHTWSVIRGSYVGFNRRELSATTPDWVNIDHRAGAAFAPGDMIAYLQAAWEDSPDTKIYIAAVHQLSDIGAVVTHVARGISQEGFDAEWRDIHLLTVEGDMLSRSELFDEADLDTAIETFGQLSRPTPRLENAASQACERFLGHWLSGDWDAVSQILADDVSHDDRRRVVGAGVRHGREAEIADLREFDDLGITNVTVTVIATRGERLALMRGHLSFREQGPEAFRIEIFGITEINADERIVAVLMFDSDDFDSAIEELDARYLAGEGAAHAHTWSVITRGCAALNQREPLPTTPDWVNIDHRRGIAFAPGDLTAYVHTAWDLLSDGGVYIETAYRVSDFGGVFTWVGYATSEEGVDVEFRGINVLTVEGDLTNRIEIFDETDLDAALARFEELGGPAHLLENAASRRGERYLAHIAAGEWEAMAEMLAETFSTDDRRRVVGAGIRHGRDAHVADMRVIADLSSMDMTSTVVAIRGERLALLRANFSGRDSESEAFLTEVLVIVETGVGEQIVAVVSLDPDDFDTAIKELDARYLAGEAAAYALTWSVMSEGFAATNRHELSQISPDCVSIDHRRGAAYGPGELVEYVRAGWELGQNIRTYVEVVHRLNEVGVVCTHAAQGISREGFNAEWRGVDLLMLDGDMVNRCELFDETDLDAAIARFEQLSRPTSRPENAASRVAERFSAHFVAGDWDAMAETLADNFSRDDRRRVVGAGVRHGPNAWVTDARSTADLWSVNVTSTAIATRGERLVLLRGSFVHRNKEPEAFVTELLVIAEINADERIVAFISFDLDDFDAAIEELDARYLRGEGATYAHTWSLILGAFAAFNRHELPAVTQDWANDDHRRGRAFSPGDLIPYIRATVDLTPNVMAYVETVHLLNKLGAVLTHVVRGTSREGFDAEWREVLLFTIEGDLLDRCEIFDEADIETALARFEELQSQSRRLENAASRADQRLMACVSARDWDAMAAMLIDSYSVDDRRHAVNVGLLTGRDVAIASAQEIAGLGIRIVPSGVIATRGERLVLSRLRWQWSGPDQAPEGFHTEVLNIVEINAEERIVARTWFDVNEIDAAFEELDTRYLAGEAAAYSHSWSVITRGYAEFNQHEFSAPDWVNIDHRRARAFAPGELTAYMHATMDLAPNVTVYVEAVYRLSNLGAVVTHVVRGTSREGFDAEWREVLVLTIEGDAFNRCEVFDDADIDTAIARFDELDSQAPRLENAASRLAERFLELFKARDWDAMAEMLADNYFNDDRRRVVGAGVRHGRADQIASMRLLAGAAANITLTVIATRGERLALTRMLSSNSDLRHGEFGIEMLGIVEIDTDNSITTQLLFDPDDVHAAYEELEARYLAGEASAYSQAWSVIAGTFSGLNRREVPPTAPDWVNVDRRRVTTTAAGDLVPTLWATWDLMPDFAIRLETVHRLTDFGAAFTYMARGTSEDGVEAEWREIAVLSIENDRITRCELFDESDIDAALARLQELRPRPRVENAASRAHDRFFTYFRARNWAAIAELLTEDSVIDDRHDMVTTAGFWDGRDAVIANLQALAEAAPISWSVVATRAERLTLTRICSPNRDQRQGEFSIEMLVVAEIDTDERIASQLSFDIDDIDAAFEELDARYLAGEAAAHAQTWSIISDALALLNRREIPAMAPDFAEVDHRALSVIGAGDLKAFLRATWDLLVDTNIHIEAVHRLTDRGAVISHLAKGTSHDGLDAEWRMTDVMTVEGNQINRCEFFEEADVDPAVARFEELQLQQQRLENAASQVFEHLQSRFLARDWPAVAEVLAEDICTEDRRRVVNGGIRHGRDAEMESLQGAANVGTAKVTSAFLATRGTRLVLAKTRLTSKDPRPTAFHAEMLGIGEINADNRVTAEIVFDLDDIDAAFEELDARYLAGEAAAHAQTWSVIAGLYAGFNRRELPATTPDWTYVDHRPLVKIKARELSASIQALWEQTSDISIYMEAVHRLSDLGAVVTHTARGISHDDFDAEWRMINLYRVDGDSISHLEMFDEAELEAALARFDEFDRPGSSV
ncbi:BTAD domain-containing putative transcriptional regulator [Mycobacterium sp. 852002-51163_SCH5372311]|uniref:BTAD domain-containing putative transcriptional regulator n=1 Tax=Mycobacterium sp. 852002-51163_SCH5372311 TaxID=1834097 RepID=UPI001E365C4F